MLELLSTRTVFCEAQRQAAIPLALRPAAKSRAKRSSKKVKAMRFVCECECEELNTKAKKV
jgi:hypothetical protein